MIREHRIEAEVGTVVKRGVHAANAKGAAANAKACRTV